jgi:Ca-activated chloride channel family protein
MNAVPADLLHDIIVLFMFLLLPVCGAAGSASQVKISVVDSGITFRRKAMKRLFLLLVLVGFCCCASPLPAFVLSGNGNNLPLVSQNVTVSIDSQVAVTRLDQTFHNAGDQPIAARYRFPLSEKASVQEFGLTTAQGERQAGAIETKQDAETKFNQALQTGAVPALGQTGSASDPNSFETQIGTLLPRSSSRVDVTYSEILPYQSGTIRYALPMNIKSVQEKSLDLTSVTINLKDQKEIIAVTSPSHEIFARKIDAHSWQITFEKANWLPAADFQLAYEVKAERMGFNFLSTHPAADEQGYFMMMLAPQEVVDAADIAERDIVFVMDTSGSMQGYKLEQTKAAFSFFIDQLNERDRFEVISFSSTCTPFRGELVAASADQRTQAKNFIRDRQAQGGTHIDLALERARTTFTDQTRTRAILFLTDGQPTIGVTNIEAIAQRMKAGNTSQIRTFVLGVGEDVSTQLLDKIALENRGETLYVRQNEPIESRLTGFYETISKPLLVDLSIDWKGANVSEIYPRQLPNVYKGSQITVFGRYIPAAADQAAIGQAAADPTPGIGSAAIGLATPSTAAGASLAAAIGSAAPGLMTPSAAAHSITVSGTLNGQNVEYPVETRFMHASAENRFVARLWAKSKADSLIQEMRAYGENAASKAEVIKLSKTFQFVTPYTSFISVAPAPVAPPRQLTRAPHGQSRPAPVSAPAAPAAPATPLPANFTSLSQPNNAPVTIIQTTTAKPISMWGISGFVPAAAVLVPNFKKARESSRVKSCMANMRVILGAIEMYNMDQPALLPTNIMVPFPTLMAAGYLKSECQCPTTGGYYQYVGLASDTTGTLGEVRCTVHHTADNPYLKGVPLNGSDPTARVEVKVVSSAWVDLWNSGLGGVIEWTINIPIFLIGLYLTYYIFLKVPLSFFLSLLRSSSGPSEGQ